MSNQNRTPPEVIARFTPDQLDAYRAGYGDGWNDRHDEQAAIDEHWRREILQAYGPRATPTEPTGPDRSPETIVREALASWGFDADRERSERDG